LKQSELHEHEEGVKVMIRSVLFCLVCVCVVVSGLFAADDGAMGEAAKMGGEQVLIDIYDNVSGPASGEAEADGGYSAFIRYRGQTILFDGGTSPVILEHNAKVLGVDLTEVDTVVLSHSHGDHTGGINHVVAVNPDVAIYVPAGWGFGSPDPDTGRKLRRGHRWLADEYHALGATAETAEGVHLIHTTSPHTGVFWKYPPYDREPRLYELPELSLALTMPSGDVFLVVGCSHSGVNEIIRATKEAVGADIAMVTGGFHLNPYDREYVAEIARSMKEDLGVRKVAPTHCTGDEAIEVFKEVFGDDFVWGGLGARIVISQ
jgi:7,8-dihydropterin-6-yl-methyl-4-(beta-D-ribofuranosyl)aminobenzene 5'-phosphate synthase